MTPEMSFRARLKRVLDFIYHHLDIYITIAMLSREAGSSPFHFARPISRSYGQLEAPLGIRKLHSEAEGKSVNTGRLIRTHGVEA